MGGDVCLGGLTPTDETFKKMVTIANLCEEQNISPPVEVQKFLFSAQGLPIEIDGISGLMRPLDIGKEWRDGDEWGIDVKVGDIPAHVKYLRFACSY